MPERSPAQFKVKNWERFQHYKDRNPPWIKLHFAILASEDWVTLDDASRVLMLACMLVASKNDGMVPNNPAYLKRVAYLNRAPNFNPLISCGFLEIPLANASTLQADASTLQANARPETEQRREEKKDSSETSSDPPAKTKGKQPYPLAFEAFWKAYPTSPNMSKAKALDGWRKLTDGERQACGAAVPGYRAFLASKRDHPVMHATTFINERRFEGFAAAVPDNATLPSEQWEKRLIYGRRERKWSTTSWGPRPGLVGCFVPADLLQEGDGDGWREMELATG